MSLEENVTKPKVSKGAVVLIALLYLVLEIVIELVTMLPQMIGSMVSALKADKNLDTEALVDDVFNNLSVPWYQNVLKILVIILIIYLLKKQQVNFFEKVKLTYANWLEIISLSVGIVALNAAIEWVVSTLNPGFNTGNQVVIDAMIANTGTLTMFVSVVLIAPVIEEILMRGLFIGVFFKERPWLGLLISSTIFALLHSPTDITSFIIYFVPGLMLGLLYMKTKWLGAPIIAHMLNNLLSFI